MDHYATAHSRPEYRCIKCNLTSSSFEHFSIHSAQCTEIPDIDICDFCPYIFDASKPFDKFNHIKSHLMNSDAVDNSATVLNASGINTYGWRFLRFVEISQTLILSAISHRVIYCKNKYVLVFIGHKDLILFFDYKVKTSICLYLQYLLLKFMC